jgi:hypothetical protein
MCLDGREYGKSDYGHKGDTTYFQLECKAREEYLKTVFKLRVVKSKQTKDFLLIKTHPKKDIIFLVGHWNSVAEVLRRQRAIFENENLAVISCIDEGHKAITVLKEIQAKNIYIPRINSEKLGFYESGYKGFDFSITDTEVQMYKNRKKSFDEIIESAFTKLE